MGESKKLKAGVIRNDRQMADGRTIRYYDTSGQARNAEDARPVEEQPGIGELRLDPLVNEWVAMAAHRQGRIFLPPKELCPLCPTTGELLTEIPESDFEVVVFDNRSPSLRPPDGDWALPNLVGPDTDLGTAAGKCEVICFTESRWKWYTNVYSPLHFSCFLFINCHSDVAPRLSKQNIRSVLF